MILWQTSLVAHYWELNCRNSQPESKNACLHFLIWAWNCKVQVLWRTKQNLTFLTGNHSLAKKTSFWSVLEARETSNWLKKRCFHLGCQRIMKNTVSRIDIFSQTLTQLALLHGIWLTSKVSNLEHWRWSKLVYYGNEGARPCLGPWCGLSVSYWDSMLRFEILCSFNLHYQIKINAHFLKKSKN